MNPSIYIAQVVWLDWLRRKDFYILLALLCALLLVLTTLDLFGLRGSARYALDIGLLLTWIFSWYLAVNAGARELPAEETRGTIFILLSKPVHRAHLLVGKWLGAWSSAGVALLAFYGVSWGLSASQGVSLSPWLMFQAVVLHLFAIAVFAGLGILFSTRMSRDAAAVLAGMAGAAALVLPPRLPQMLAKADPFSGMAMEFLYYALPHLELFDLRRRLVHEFGPLDTGIFMALVLYGVLLTVIILLLSWGAYRRKSFSRERLAT